MVAPRCSTICGPPSAAAIAAAVAEATGCCPTLCATAFTTGDTSETVPEFDLAVEDGQLVEVTVTGYVTRVDSNIAGAQGGFVYFRGMARRLDADTVQPGLAILLQNTMLQSLSAGLATAFNISGDTLQFLIDGDTGEYRWDLEMSRCVRDQIVDITGEA
jgi:hypothetical protein